MGHGIPLYTESIKRDYLNSKMFKCSPKYITLLKYSLLCHMYSAKKFTVRIFRVSWKKLFLAKIILISYSGLFHVLV